MKPNLLELWGIRGFRLHVYSAIALTVLTTPLAYKVATLMNEANVVYAARVFIVTKTEQLKSTAFFIEKEAPW